MNTGIRIKYKDMAIEYKDMAIEYKDMDRIHPNSIFTYTLLHLISIPPTYHFTSIQSPLPLTTPNFNPPCLSLHFNPILIPLTTPNSNLPYPSLLLFPILPASHFT